MLWKYIKEKMLQTPNQIISENNIQFTYEEVVIFSEVFAKKLYEKKCCAIHCESEMFAGISILACFAANVTAVPLSPRYGELHSKKILDIISPDCIISDKDGELKAYDIPSSQYNVPPTPPALIMCTSGTTGIPKGAMLTKTNILTNLEDIHSYFNVTKNDKFLIARPLYHCAVLTGEFLTALTSGAELVFCSERFNPIQLVRLLQEEHITVLGATPSLYNIISRLVRNSSVLRLNKLVISGECMSEAIGKRIRDAFPNADIYHVYGMTEAAPRLLYLPPEEFDFTPDHVGIPLNSVSIKIINKSGFPATTNEDGILYVKGKNIMLGYYNATELTNKVLREGWLCTGDIASMNKNGRIKIKGRADNMIIRAGMNIYPQEIEAELKKDPRTQEVLVYGKTDKNREITQIALKIVGDFQNSKEVKEMCIKLLPSYQIPEIIDLVNMIEKNASGKIIRNQ